MRSINEIKQDSRLEFKGLPTFPFPALGGIMTLSNGKKASFMMSVESEIEHVSMMYLDRLPKWSEMCELKDVFWEDEEDVIQIHPRKSNYVNITDALHLWRPVDGDWNKLMKYNEKDMM